MSTCPLEPEPILRSIGRRDALGVALLALSLAACDRAAPLQPGEPESAAGAANRAASVEISTYATGLDNPRGLTFGPDGGLYVAEGGRGGSLSTEGRCEQVIAPVGPYTGDYTARISRISASGERTTVADGLPSSQTAPALGSLVSGVGDVAFVGNTLYALLAGAGCSHGIADVPNGVVRIEADGSWTLVADLSAFQAANPVAHPEEEDFEPDGTWYSMVAVNGDLYAVEPNHGEVDRIHVAGHGSGSAGISRVVDVSASEGHVVPTAIAHHGSFYLANLTTFPLVPGAATVFHLTPGGKLANAFGHLTGAVGLAFDARGELYALESTVCPTADPCGPTPGTGAVVHVARNGAVTTVASGLMFPTGMTFGPDGALYVSVNGFGFPPGAGEVLRIAISH